MHFKRYLNEKVSKSELNQIFNDDSILVGAEFEFFLPDAIRSVEESIGIDMEELFNIWDSFVQELTEWRHEIEALQDEYSKQMNKENEHEIRRKMNDLEELTQEINDKYSEMTFKIPEMPQELINYNEYLGNILGSKYVENFDPLEYLQDTITYENKYSLLEPESEFEDSDFSSIEFFETAQKMLEDELNINIKVNMSPGKNDNWWGIMEDESVSLQDGGLELISPPMPMPEFIKKTPQVLKFISNNGNLSNETGFHATISIDGVDFNADLDVVKLILFHDEEFIYKHFDERRFNRYAGSVTGKLDNMNFTISDIHKVLNMEKIEKRFRTSKNYGINLEKVEGRNIIEFRYIGGSKYDQKWDSIKSIIGNHAYNLKLSTDRSFRRQDYAKKMYKLMMKNINNNKDMYFSVVLYSYIADSIIKQYNTVDAKVLYSEIMSMRDRRLENENINYRNAVNIYKSLSYGKSEVENYIRGYIGNLLNNIGVPERFPELHEFIQNLLGDVNKLIHRDLNNYIKK